MAYLKCLFSLLLAGSNGHISRKDECIGIVGESGVGKSTLSDILLGLYVPQLVFLMDDTIRRNVAFGEKMVDGQKVWKALEQARLKDYVLNLPDGLDTIVGERGIKLSGGQRQRVAIARALYNKPVFDTG